MPVTFGFEGQTVLITGAATGLGFAAAEAFGQAGARVAVNDLSADRVERAYAALAGEGIDCRGFAADVRDAEAVKCMVAAVEAWAGSLDVLVANAGIYPNTPFLEIAEDEWDRVLDTNLKGVFLTCRAAARVMVRAGRGGRILMIGSGAANHAIWGWSHYCASKAAVVMLMRAMALELATASGSTPSCRATSTFRKVGAISPPPTRTRPAQPPRLGVPPSRRTSPTHCCSWLRRSPASSPARSSPSTAAAAPVGSDSGRSARRDARRRRGARGRLGGQGERWPYRSR